MSSSDKFFGGIALKLLKGFVLENSIDPGKIDPGSIKNILIILRHQMGDLITATPMLRSLKTAFPEAKLILVTKSSTRYNEIYTGVNSIADEVFMYENGFENFINLVKQLRERKIDLAIVPSTVVYSATNHLQAYYSNAKIRVGVKSHDYEDNPVGYLLNVKNEFLWESKRIHQTQRNLDILRQFVANPSDVLIKINLNLSNLEFAEKFYTENNIDRSKPVISIHPGAAKAGNVWPAEKFGELANLLNKKFDASILISEGPLDKKYADDLAAILKEKYSIERILRHKGLLMNNLALIGLSDLFITNDTGVMHLASGLENPLIALFGPTKAFQWGPLGNDKISIQSASSNIQNIDVNEVFEQSIKLLYYRIRKKKA